jgi:hypothetical protein
MLTCCSLDLCCLHQSLCCSYPTFNVARSTSAHVLSHPSLSSLCSPYPTSTPSPPTSPTPLLCTTPAQIRSMTIDQPTRAAFADVSVRHSFFNNGWGHKANSSNGTANGSRPASRDGSNHARTPRGGAEKWEAAGIERSDTGYMLTPAVQKNLALSAEEVEASFSTFKDI